MPNAEKIGSFMYLPCRLHTEKRYYAKLWQFKFCRDRENEVKVKKKHIKSI